MKKISEIRRVIADIPGIFFEGIPEDAERSNDPAVKTIWDYDRHWDSLIEAEMNCSDSEDNQEEGHGGLMLTGPEELFEYGAEIDEKELVNALGGNKGNELKRAFLASQGRIGDLGWYITFHAKNINPGIYIPISSVVFLLREYLWHLQSDIWTKFKLAFRAIHQHELFHFATDYMTAQWEGITSSPCKIIALEMLRNNRLGYNPLEEELANTQMLYSFRWANKPLNVKGKTAALRKFVEQGKEGYCNAVNNTKIEIFERKCFVLSSDHISYIPGYEGKHLSAVNINNLFPRFPQLDWRYCPIHIIHDEKRFDLPLITLDLPRVPQ